MSFYASYPISGGGGVTSLNSATGALTLAAGTGITVSTVGTTITIASTDIAAAITSINGDITPAQVLSVGTAGTSFAIVDAGSGSHVFNLPTASNTNTGALSSSDWSTFNSKQTAGSYITALTGDGTAAGPGSVAFTLATVNSNVGSFTNANITVNAKGLITAVSNGTSGTVTTISVVSTNGLAGTVTNPTSTPALTLSTTVTGILQGNGTAISAASTTGTGNVVLSASPTLTGTLTAATIAASGTVSGSNLTSAGHANADLALVGGTMSGAINMGAAQINNMANPTSAQDAATKTYVDTTVANNGVTKDGVIYATTAALATNVYNNGSSGVGATLTGVAVGALTIDGSAPSVGQRVLIKNEVTQANNGIYVVTTTGSVSVVYILTRSADFNQSSEIITGASAFVVSGTANTSTTWDMNATGTITVGTSAITFAQTSGPGSVTAGTGITVTGSVIALTTPVGVANGGTGQTSYTNGQLLIGNTSGSTLTPATLTAGSNITITNGAGAITIAATASTPTLAVSTKTSAYTAVTTDSVLLCDATSGSFNLTLYTAVGNAGAVIYVKKIDGSTNVTTIRTTSSQTIDGYANRSLNTMNEEYAFVSDGTNWQILDHFWDTTWSTPTATIWAGTTTNPTKPTSPAVDAIRWRRLGETAEFWVQYKQTSSSGAAAGSGDYILALPLSMDTGLVQVYTTLLGPGAPAPVADAFGSGLATYAGSESCSSVAIPYSNTQVRVMNTGPVIGPFNASSNFVFTQTTLSLSLRFTAPITGWCG